MLFGDFRQNYLRYGPVPSTHDYYKAAAILLMVVDHVGHFYFPEQLWFRVIGRFCVPIWFFLAGYSRKGSKRGEFILLGLMMVATDALLHERIFPVNIFAATISGRWLLDYLDRQKQDVATFVVIYAICTILWLATFLLFEYGSLAYLLMIAGYYHRNLPGKWQAYFSLVIAYAAFVPLQVFTIEFVDVRQIAALAAGCALVFWLLSRYRITFKPNHRDTIGDKAIMYVARNSHYFYALHFIAMECVAYFFFDPGHTRLL